jgi:hypothetical protein
MWSVVITVIAIAVGAYFMSAALDRLKAEIAENKTVTASVLALVSSVSDQLRELSAKVAAGDAAEAEIAALADELDANTNALAGAVTQNTPVADEPSTTEPSTPTTDTPVTNEGESSPAPAEGDDTTTDRPTA